MTPGQAARAWSSVVWRPRMARLIGMFMTWPTRRTVASSPGPWRCPAPPGLRWSAVPVQGVVQTFGGPVKVKRGVLTSLQGSAGVLHPLTYHVKCA
jgi:hypothetical protein